MATNPNQPGGLFARLGRGLSNFMVGEDDPRLSKAQNDMARRRSMANVTLQLLMSGGKSGISPLQGLAMAGMQGQEMGYGMRGQFAQQNEQERVKSERMQRLQQAIGNGEIDQATLKRVFLDSIKAGDLDSARMLSEVLKSMGNDTKAQDSGAYMERVNMDGPQGPGFYTYDRRNPEQTLKFLGKAPKEQLSPAQQAMQDQRTIMNEDRLWGQYNSRIGPLQQAWRPISNALRQANSALEGNGAAQINLLYAFVRAMDPTSVVREGEVKLAESAMNMWERMKMLRDKNLRGEQVVIGDRLVREMVDLMREQLGQYEEWWGEEYEDLKTRGARQGVDVSGFTKPPQFKRSDKPEEKRVTTSVSAPAGMPADIASRANALKASGKYTPAQIVNMLRKEFPGRVK